MNNYTLKTIAVGISILTAVVNNLYGQTSKESRTIVINNGDTLVNGKKISELNRSERQKVQQDFEDMRQRLKESQVEINGTGIIIEHKSDKEGIDNSIVIRRSDKAPGTVVWHNGDSSKTLRFDVDGHKGDFLFRRFKGDSILASLNIDSIRIKRFNRDGIEKYITSLALNDSVLFSMNDSAMVKRFRYDFDSRTPIMHPRTDNIEIPNGLRRGHDLPMTGDAPSIYLRNRNNSQSFSYSNTDKNGITSRMNIRLSDPAKEDLKKITGSDGPTALAVEDLTLFPNFSSGKMTMSFNLSGKGTMEVKILDSDRSTIFSDRPVNFSGNYIKQISLPKNSVYYVAISQNGKWFVKKLVKEQ